MSQWAWEVYFKFKANLDYKKELISKQTKIKQQTTKQTHKSRTVFSWLTTCFCHLYPAVLVIFTAHFTSHFAIASHPILYDQIQFLLMLYI